MGPPSGEAPEGGDPRPLTPHFQTTPPPCIVNQPLRYAPVTLRYDRYAGFRNGEIWAMVAYAKVRLWADRVRLVRRYLASPTAWPDGIDTKYERWHQGREAYWAGLAGNLDNAGAWAGGIDDDAAYKRFGLLAAPVREASSEVGDGPVSAAERMRRYRERQAAARKAGG